MAYMDAKSKHGMAIEMKEKGYVSLKQTAGEDEYYSTIANADNTIVTARTPPVLPAIPNRVQNQQTKNVISDSQLKSRFDTIYDDINLLKKKNNRLKTGLIIAVFVIFVAIGAVSATAMIFKQNLEDNLKRTIETQLASTNEARVSEGNWTYWSNWEACSVTCNFGVRRRTRTCNGIDQDGLLGTCSGNDLDISTCTNEECTTRVSEYRWSHWLNWGTCSATCNVGVRRRTRTCNGIGQDGLLGTCSGCDFDISICNDKDCTPRVLEYSWSHWLNWGTCSATCNVGVRRRTRTCNGTSQDGLPETCSGNDLDVSTCTNEDCTPLDSDGIWALWSIWGECSATCNTGVRSRNRACKGQDGSLGICSGNGLDISSCSTKDCNRSNWTQWFNWGACSTTCNAGVRRRKRTCSSQYGQQGFCLGNDVDISICNNDECTQEVGPSDFSFTSYLTTSLTNVKLGTTVLFDGVSNNDGNAYDSSTGVFTCPTAGKYLFSLTVAAFNDKTTVLRLLIDGVGKAYAISEPAFNGQDSTGTGVVVYHINVGQRVWVETHIRDNPDIFKGFTRFVGVLIHR